MSKSRGSVSTYFQVLLGPAIRQSSQEASCLRMAMEWTENVSEQMLAHIRLLQLSFG